MTTTPPEPDPTQEPTEEPTEEPAEVPDDQEEGVAPPARPYDEGH